VEAEWCAVINKVQDQNPRQDRAGGECLMKRRSLLEGLPRRRRWPNRNEQPRLPRPRNPRGHAQSRDAPGAPASGLPGREYAAGRGARAHAAAAGDGILFALGSSRPASRVPAPLSSNLTLIVGDCSAGPLRRGDGRLLRAVASPRRCSKGRARVAAKLFSSGFAAAIASSSAWPACNMSWR